MTEWMALNVLGHPPYKNLFELLIAEDVSPLVQEASLALKLEIPPPV